MATSPPPSFCSKIIWGQRRVKNATGERRGNRFRNRRPRKGGGQKIINLSLSPLLPLIFYFFFAKKEKEFGKPCVGIGGGKKSRRWFDGGPHPGKIHESSGQQQHHSVYPPDIPKTKVPEKGDGKNLFGPRVWKRRLFGTGTFGM